MAGLKGYQSSVHLFVTNKAANKNLKSFSNIRKKISFLIGIKRTFIFLSFAQENTLFSNHFKLSNNKYFESFEAKLRRYTILLA